MRGTVPVLIGAAGTDKTFAWIARSADGWITTPRDEDVVGRIGAAAGRLGRCRPAGDPRVVALDGRPDAERLATWAEGGVTDVVYGLPDRAADESRPTWTGSSASSTRCSRGRWAARRPGRERAPSCQPAVTVRITASRASITPTMPVTTMACGLRTRVHHE